MFVTKNTFSTHDMIALAYAVDRVNGGYVKFNDLSSNKTSNRDLLMDQIRKQEENPHANANVKTIEITKQDRVAAQNVELKLKHLVLNSIRGFSNTFEANMYQTVFSETVLRQNLPMISFVPEYVRRETEKRATTRTVVNNYSESQWIHKPNDVVGTVHLLRCIWLSNFEKYMYLAATASGNLIRFYIKEKFDVNTHLRITSCKIKNHETDRETGMPTTVLNFVRYKKS